MKTAKMHLLSLGFALASVVTIYTSRADASPRDDGYRGTIEVNGAAVRAVTAGPALVHAYSGFSGGVVFVVPRVVGSDADCAPSVTSAARRSTTLIADRVALISVGSDEIACLATNTHRPFELLWHSFPTDGAPMLIADARLPGRR